MNGQRFPIETVLNLVYYAENNNEELFGAEDDCSEIYPLVAFMLRVEASSTGVIFGDEEMALCVQSIERQLKCMMTQEFRDSFWEMISRASSLPGCDVESEWLSEQRCKYGENILIHPIGYLFPLPDTFDVGVCRSESTIVCRCRILN